MDPRPHFPQLSEGATPSCPTSYWIPTSTQAWTLTRLPPLAPQSRPPLCPGAATASWVGSLLQGGCPGGPISTWQPKWPLALSQMVSRLCSTLPAAARVTAKRPWDLY